LSKLQIFEVLFEFFAEFFMAHGKLNDGF